MAKKDHVEIVKKGFFQIQKWREEHPKEYLDLSEADLSGIKLVANLSKTDLRGANLSGSILTLTSFYKANLSETNFSKAIIHQCQFEEASMHYTILDTSEIRSSHFNKSDLVNADFCNAIITHTTFFDANLKYASFSKAHLSNVNFIKCNLRNVAFHDVKMNGGQIFVSELDGANFSNAELDSVILSGLDSSKADFTNMIFHLPAIIGCRLENTKNLRTVKFRKEGTVDLITLADPFRTSGKISEDLKIFFINLGVPSELIDYFPQLAVEAKFYRCFLCHGQPDEAFASRLVDDLRERGIQCWFYPIDSTIGESSWREITKKRRESDKMIVLCSCKSLIRDRVLKEIEEQIDEDPEKIIPISLDNVWKEKGFPVKRGDRDLKPFLLERNYADFNDESRYYESLNKLKKALKK